MPYLVLLLRTVFKVFVHCFTNLSTKESGWMALSGHETDTKNQILTKTATLGSWESCCCL